MRRALAVLLTSLALLVPSLGAAQVPVQPVEPQATRPEAQPPAEPRTEPESVPPAVEALPQDPVDRLKMAKAAFRRAEYGLLVPLLDTLAGPDSALPSGPARVEARELLVVGYFFLAQQVTTSTDRDELLEKARVVALVLLREKPDHALDTLIFPVSVVDLFEAVRRDNTKELDRLLSERQSGTGSDPDTVYLERVSTQHLGWLNFLPFGAGQFQNGHLVKGTTFAFLQAAGLAVNITSYWMIVRLRDPATGRYSSEGALKSDLASAKRWRQVLYGGLAGFAVVWAVSVLDGWLNFQSETVRIRTLDAPPPELGGPAASGVLRGHPLGLTLEVRW